MSRSIDTGTTLPTAMTSAEQAFFKALGARITDARKALGMTQTQLADELGVTQQVIASYEVGRRRVQVMLLPRLAHALAVGVEDLIGGEGQPARRGPAPRLLQQVERIQRLPRSRQRFVMEMIDTALQANVTAEAAE
jgi:transcriptional regulator with XRE-family HTH domain